jgi:hypothetical protein
MPEAAIDEDSDPIARKADVSPSAKSWEKVVDPESESSAM